MKKWIEDFKNIYVNANMEAEEKECLIIALEEKCYDKGYSLKETEEVVQYVLR